jgi:hypothetical protein
VPLAANVGSGIGAAHGCGTRGGPALHLHAFMPSVFDKAPSLAWSMTCFCLSLGPTQQLAYGWGQVVFCESQQQALSGCEPPSDVNRSGVKR